MLLYFTKRERIGAAILLAAIFTSFLIPEIAAGLQDTNKPLSSRPIPKPVRETPQPFFFDPNTAEEQDFIVLGLPPKTARSILNYREKGGRFRTPDELGKIYSLSPDDFKRLRPFVRIQHALPNRSYEKVIHKERPRAFSHKRDSVKPHAGAFQKEHKKPGPININTATLESWQGLPGIGAWRADRIVRYRESLGGFLQPEQVGETFGIPDSVFQNIQPFLTGGGVLRALNVNTASLDELKAHPYLSAKDAGALIAKRTQNGPIPSATALEQLLAHHPKWHMLQHYLSL
jgi:competence ComEA-like helix-hairpin-helix protein